MGHPRAYKLGNSLTWRVAVPLALTFGIVFSVAFDYLAHDLSGDTTIIPNVKAWHFLLVTALFSIVFMFVWYAQVRNYLSALLNGMHAHPPNAGVAWIGISLQLLNAIISILFIIGGATTWFSGTTIPSTSTDPIRIYTIIIGAFGVIAFGLSGGFGIWVQLAVQRIARLAMSGNQQYSASYDQAVMLPGTNNLSEHTQMPQAPYGVNPYGTAQAPYGYSYN